MFWKLHRYLEKYHIFLKNLYPEESILNFIGVGSIFLDEDDNDDNGDDANDFEDSTNAEDAHDWSDNTTISNFIVRSGHPLSEELWLTGKFGEGANIYLLPTPPPAQPTEHTNSISHRSIVLKTKPLNFFHCKKIWKGGRGSTLLIRKPKIHKIAQKQCSLGEKCRAQRKISISSKGEGHHPYYTHYYYLPVLGMGRGVPP